MEHKIHAIHHQPAVCLPEGNKAIYILPASWYGWSQETINRRRPGQGSNVAGSEIQWFLMIFWDLYMVNDDYYMVNITGFGGNILLIYG